MARIDERLNLIIPVDRYDGTTIHIHATPIGREVFQKYFLVMAKAFAAIWADGLNNISGPRVAALMLREIAVNMGIWEGPEGVNLGLMSEIKRLANVIAPAAGRWDIVPLDQAIQAKMVDDDDVDEIVGNLVFFSLTWHLNRRKEREYVMGTVAARLDASMSSLSLSAFVNSLPIPIATGNTGGTPLAA